MSKDVQRSDSYAMLMSPNKDETGVHGCRCPNDMAVRVPEVLAKPWVGVCVSLALSLTVLSKLILRSMQVTCNRLEEKWF